MKKKSVQEIIEEAAKAAALAPEHLQEIAFSKAFDALSSSDDGSSAGVMNSPGRVSDTEKGKSETAVNLDLIDRTSHPEINHENSALNNSLRLLVAARNDLGVDGLTAAEISKTLTEKFRASVTRQTVGRALNSAGRFVNRFTEGAAVKFQIMGPGEDYLKSDESSVDVSNSNSKPKKGKKKKQASKKKSNSKPKSKSSVKAKRRIGPDSALRHLLEKGFFKEPKKIGEITATIEKDMGRRFKSSEVSPVLLRYLRNGDLQREKNEDNQYEYTNV